MFTLHPYPSPMPLRLVIAATAGLDGDKLRIVFTVSGADLPALVLPLADGPPCRRDGLWRTTCFELFVRGAEGSGYAELNLAPSGDWAAYAFDGYRAGMRNLEVQRAIAIARASMSDHFTIEALLDPAPLIALLGAPPWRIGLSAVIEAPQGQISYWALAHPPEKPDFHHDACFAGELAAPPVP